MSKTERESRNLGGSNIMNGLAKGRSGDQKRTKKKILIITNHSYMLWQFRRELITELMKDYEVVLSMPFVGHETDFQNMGLRCIKTDMERRGMNPITDMNLIRQYRSMLKKEQPDLVITYSIKPNVYAGWLCGRMGIPFCANVQGLGSAFQNKALARMVTFLYKRAFRKVRTVFFENEINAREFQKRNIFPIEKQKILRGAGINLSYYSLQPYPENEKFHFLYLGRIMKEKGIDELFYAVRRLHKENKNFVLDLVGFFEEEYRDIVEKLEQEGIVKFYGFHQDPRPFYTKADCVVLPSYHEGMSNVLLEAGAMGRPVITSNIPGCREAVDKGKNGYLVKPRDRESLYQAMKKFMTLDPGKRALMGRAGREKMKKEFRKEIVVQETLDALKLDQI